MTIPYLMNCRHSDDGWCIECTGDLGRECDAAIEMNRSLHSAINRLKEDIIKLQADRADLVTIGRAARAFTRNHCNVTTRRFAAICGMSPARLCHLIGDMPTGKPDFVD